MVGCNTRCGAYNIVRNLWTCCKKSSYLYWLCRRFFLNRIRLVKSLRMYFVASILAGRLLFTYLMLKVFWFVKLCVFTELDQKVTR